VILAEIGLDMTRFATAGHLGVLGEAVPRVTAQRHRHRQVRDHLPRIMDCPAPPPPPVRARHLQGPGQQHRASLGDDPLPSAVTVILGRAAIVCTRKVLLAGGG
jgi:hypothetical protein